MRRTDARGGVVRARRQRRGRLRTVQPYSAGPARRRRRPQAPGVSPWSGVAAHDELSGLREALRRGLLLRVVRNRHNVVGVNRAPLTLASLLTASLALSACGGVLHALGRRAGRPTAAAIVNHRRADHLDRRQRRRRPRRRRPASSRRAPTATRSSRRRSVAAVHGARRRRVRQRAAARGADRSSSPRPTPPEDAAIVVSSATRCCPRRTTSTTSRSRRRTASPTPTCGPTRPTRSQYADVIQRHARPSADPDNADDYAANHDAVRREGAARCRGALEADQATLPPGRTAAADLPRRLRLLRQDLRLGGHRRGPAVELRGPAAARGRPASSTRSARSDVPVDLRLRGLPVRACSSRSASETGARYEDTLRDDDLPGEPGDAEHSWLGLMRYDYVTMIDGPGRHGRGARGPRRLGRRARRGRLPAVTAP